LPKRRKKTEEKAGRQFQYDMTPPIASWMRARRIEGKELSTKEKRDLLNAEKAAKEKKYTIPRLWEAYKTAKLDQFFLSHPLFPCGSAGLVALTILLMTKNVKLSAGNNHIKCPKLNTVRSAACMKESEDELTINKSSVNRTVGSSPKLSSKVWTLPMCRSVIVVLPSSWLGVSA
jgi:hypothetical protein